MRFRLQTLVAAAIAAMAFEAGFAPHPASAQVGFGFSLSGQPILLYYPKQVPSPTDELNAHARRQIAIQGALARPESGTNVAVTDMNAYYHRLRDTTPPPKKRTTSPHHTSAGHAASGTSAAQPKRLEPPPIDVFFRPDGHVDWPRDMPDLDALRTEQDDADAALQNVLEEVHLEGQATNDAVEAAKAKLVTYGKHALATAQSTRSAAVADGLHQYLLSLHHSLEQTAPGR